MIELLKKWLDEVIGNDRFSIVEIPSDVSERRYFRINLLSGDSCIAVYAPPLSKVNEKFRAVTELLYRHKVRVPVITAYNDGLGFMLMSDFGNNHYWKVLTETNARKLYKPVFNQLTCIQSATKDASKLLPAYDDSFIQGELDLFVGYFLKRYMGFKLSEEAMRILEESFKIIKIALKEQPQVCVHADFQTRNLIRLKEDGVGVIDYQDAMIGPITYDLASFLYDSSYTWSKQHIDMTALEFYTLSKANRFVDSTVQDKQFLRWFHYSGIYRRLRSIGMFAMVHFERNKSQFLPRISKSLFRIVLIAEDYPELANFVKYIKHILEAVQIRNAAEVYSKKFSKTVFLPAASLPISSIGGVSNRVFRIGSNKVMRMPGNNSHVLVDRQTEFKNSTVIQRVTTPRLTDVLEDGTSLMEYVDGRSLTPTDLLDPAILKKAAGELRKLHEQSVMFINEYNISDRITLMLETIHVNEGLFWNGIENVKQVIGIVFESVNKIGYKKTTCHNDMSPYNFMRAKDCLIIIDWEYAANNDPMWDLAYISAECRLPSELDNVLLEEHGGGKYSKEDYQRFVLYKPFVHLKVSTWSKLQMLLCNESFGIDFFQRLSERRYFQFVELIRSEAFEQAIRGLIDESQRRNLMDLISTLSTNPKALTEKQYFGESKGDEKSFTSTPT